MLYYLENIRDFVNFDNFPVSENSRFLEFRQLSGFGKFQISGISTTFRFREIPDFWKFQISEKSENIRIPEFSKNVWISGIPKIHETLEKPCFPDTGKHRICSKFGKMSK
jgi:hypothetical protein